MTLDVFSSTSALSVTAERWNSLGLKASSSSKEELTARSFVFCWSGSGRTVFLPAADFEVLGGCAEAEKLPSVLQILQKTERLNITIAVCLDADFVSPDPTGEANEKGGVLFLRLPCKEMENLFLMAPKLSR